MPFPAFSSPAVLTVPRLFFVLVLLTLPLAGVTNVIALLSQQTKVV